MSTTLFDKVWDSHVVRKIEDGPMCFIDRHFIHEVTSPVAFLGLKRKVLYPERTACRSQHTNYKPTFTVEDPLSANQLRALEENSKEYGISHWGLGNKKMESFMSCPKRNYITWRYYCLRRFTLPPTVPLVPLLSELVEVVMYMQPKPKRCINVAGDLQFELHQRRCSLYYIKIVHLRRYWLFCGIRGKVLKT
jgi:3-isopropylmalate/(R)-2-methylmalate dehydratase large subunit